MEALTILKIIGISIAVVSMTILFVFHRYWGFKKALGSKPASLRYRLYIWIAFKLFILMGCIYYLWITKFTNIWVFLCLAYICWSLILLLFILKRIQKWKEKSEYVQ